jgi:hypothetical protein
MFGKLGRDLMWSSSGIFSRKMVFFSDVLDRILLDCTGLEENLIQNVAIKNPIRNVGMVVKFQRKISIGNSPGHEHG